MQAKLKDVPDTIFQRIYKGNLLVNRTSGYFCVILQMGIINKANEKWDVKKKPYGFFPRVGSNSFCFLTPLHSKWLGPGPF
jgi:hypothetical protein